jgi:hypothetical protein
MTLRRELGLTLVALLAVSATGCASMATKPGPAAAGAPPASAAHVPAPTHSTSPGTAPSTSPATAAIDSTTPSPAAQRVLGSIPEPLTPAQQALSAQAAPVDTSRMRAVAPAAAYDSLQAAPVPAATQPLGTEASTVTMDTSSAAPALSAAGGAASSTAAAGAAAGAATGAAAGAAAAASTAPASSTAATSGPCWRLQVGAPLASEKDKADSRREAAQSLLMTPFTIVPEKGYLKIRTSDCMSRDTADALKKRAVDSGFGDAFLLDTNAAPPAAAPATKHAHVPASKRKK